MPEVKLRTDLLEEMRARPLAAEDDLTLPIALTHLVRAELEAFGMIGQQQLSDSEIALAQRTLRAVLQRFGIELALPWRNFTSFKTYWLKNDANGSWQA
jgi:hypothetical protein